MPFFTALFAAPFIADVCYQPIRYFHHSFPPAPFSLPPPAPPLMPDFIFAFVAAAAFFRHTPAHRACLRTRAADA